ncbi:UNVERIFIED_CONTAM: hypothetical protein Sindi_2281800 [Sesamum indicum]
MVDGIFPGPEDGPSFVEAARTILNVKDRVLATETADMERPPFLGVVDEGDAASMVALAALTSHWEARFGHGAVGAATSLNEGDDRLDEESSAVPFPMTATPPTVSLNEVTVQLPRPSSGGLGATFGRTAKLGSTASRTAMFGHLRGSVSPMGGALPAAVVLGVINLALIREEMN